MLDIVLADGDTSIPGDIRPAAAVVFVHLPLAEQRRGAARRHGERGGAVRVDGCARRLGGYGRGDGLILRLDGELGFRAAVAVDERHGVGACGERVEIFRLERDGGAVRGGGVFPGGDRGAVHLHGEGWSYSD